MQQVRVPVKFEQVFIFVAFPPSNHRLFLKFAENTFKLLAINLKHVHVSLF